LIGEGVRCGRVRLHPKEAGSYTPPARAFFSFKQDRRVGGSTALDVGIEVDQRAGRVYLGYENGRFDHFTDLGEVAFDSVAQADTRVLERTRKDAECKYNHLYIYESCIYEPAQRTRFTGLDVNYAKVLVERIESADIVARLELDPPVPVAGQPLTLIYRPGSEGLDGARGMTLSWSATDRSGNALIAEQTESRSPAEPEKTDGKPSELGRQRFVRLPMSPRDDRSWTSRIDLPVATHRVSILFIDELGRKDPEGIRNLIVGR
jgi:hypothetical protein